MDDKRKGGGAKTSRSETVTVRLEPKIRYLAELAGRKQRRTLSSFIEWAIENSLAHVVVEEGRNEHVTIADVAESLWDVDDPDRFVRLAIRHPDLLTHEEQKRWKLIRENGWLWRGAYRGPDHEWTWEIKESSLIFERLREEWEKFVDVANGVADRSILPTWIRKDPNPKRPAPSFSDLDDDIPF